MKLSHALPAAATAILLASCQSVGTLPTEQIGSGTLMLANGVPAGTVRLVASGEEVSLAVAVAGIPAGQHGFHLHTTGECTRPDFTSAGGHLNPYGRQHGLDANTGAHLGDLSNLTVSADGTAVTTVPLRGSRSELVAQVFDADGTAVIIHADPDDGVTDPTGNAGSRIACAVLTRT